MQGRGGIIAVIANTAILIILEAVAVALLRHNNDCQESFLSLYSHAFIGSLGSGRQHVHQYFSLKRENDSLRRENLELRERLSGYEARARNTRANRIDSLYGSDDEFSYIYAPIAKVSHNKQHNYLILRRGYEDGVTEQAGVVTWNGVIGIVEAVGRHYSYALSTKNTGISVSSRIGVDGPVGTMRWDGKSKDLFIMEDIPLQSRINKGDTVYTSGFSAIFPADIPIGLAEESRIVNGATYETRVRLFCNPTSAKYVMIANNKGREEISGLEEEKNTQKR